ncbi:protein adenylyltransferase SelO family protein [Aurantiacibacter gangjinensis]|uniref:Protein nucleotidyltransferase YdiU n=1 Tax=Aurantiacibacter gangjinensis TaxID=502682 RepID=A0A0G9MNG2_9SPHN|nr:YdiU family protein [Aurantiacibacter gangjinensis]APE28226.1 Selenoprotein O and cysteine-containing homologs [Aurantiacibacter gangjinensis]KLE32124.1 selenoprotein O [Aurantiacibacter gangjinensis]
MRAEPQSHEYTPDPQIEAVTDFLADPVEAADFPETRLRFRNDRWDKTVGLDMLGDDDWVRHFGRFAPLPDNLPQPLALRYHGHQFRVYNPDLGDGRGFLFAQMRDGDGRLLDCGTKGSGTTPWSRAGDGRLTLKGAVREILATEMLEALGVNTSKTLSVIETGEALERGDEPSPTRSAVMVRLSHGHIRIGSFQRLMALEQEAELARLVEYALRVYPGPPPPEDAPGRDEPAVQLMHQVTERLAELAASYMVAGFVHGVLNTDNMNITGESFDYGPWRWLPQWQPGFTAAYFDHQGLYAFGRQPEAIRWNLGQFAIALRPLVEAPPLIAALERFPDLYEQAMARHFCWRLGVEQQGQERDVALINAAERTMTSQRIGPDEFFYRHRGGRAAEGNLAEALGGYAPTGSSHDYWAEGHAESMLIDEVETIWSAIDQRDDWEPLYDKVARLRRLGDALGEPPVFPAT